MICKNGDSPRKYCETKQKAELLLDAKDKAEVLDIIKNDSFASNDEFKKKFNL